MTNKFEHLLNSSKVNDMLAASKLAELLHKKEDPMESKKHTFIFILAVIGGIAAIAGIAYAVYKFVAPDYLEDFEDDFDDDFEDDFGEDFEDENADSLETASNVD